MCTLYRHFRPSLRLRPVFPLTARTKPCPRKHATVPCDPCRYTSARQVSHKAARRWTLIGLIKVSAAKSAPTYSSRLPDFHTTHLALCSTSPDLVAADSVISVTRVKHSNRCLRLATGPVDLVAEWFVS